MFNENFYPTPNEVIDKMIMGLEIENKVILEPSAGKGNIVNVLNNLMAKEVLMCETNPELRKILSGKGRIISDDFMKVTSEDVSHIDAIIMNPPFTADEKHILHAWEIAPPGCDIVALCNANTLNKPFSEIRKRLSTTVENYGNWENIGECFNQSERRTYVEIGLIRLRKPGSGYNEEFDGFFMEEDPLEKNGSPGIMPYNAIRSLVNKYVAAVKLFDDQINTGVKMNALISGFYKSELAFLCKEGDEIKTRNDFKKDLQKSAWKYVFDEMKMEKYITKGLKEDLNRFVETQEKIPFTMRNIYRMIEMIIGTNDSRMDKALEEVFDQLTKHYHDNRYAVEGWKTNSHYLINEKFILPYMTEIKYGGSMGLVFRGNYELVEDMNKAIHWMLGKNYQYNDSLWRYFHAGVQYDFGKWYDWGFFEIKGFKKGTMHFKFKDQEIWGKFNQRISKIKGYPLFEAA